MTDIVNAARRSEIMSRIKGRNTTPELVVRRIAHRLGFRFRLHRRDLPGSPDMVFLRHRTIIFVHGCFWHRHDGCRYAYRPKSRIQFWMKKFEDNLARDARNEMALRDLGLASPCDMGVRNERSRGCPSSALGPSGEARVCLGRGRQERIRRPPGRAQVAPTRVPRDGYGPYSRHLLWSGRQQRGRQSRRC